MVQSPVDHHFLLAAHWKASCRQTRGGGGGGFFSSEKLEDREKKHSRCGLTRPDLDWPDEDGAERKDGHHGHASSHHHHDVVIEPHTGWAALHGAEETRRRRRNSVSSGSICSWSLFKGAATSVEGRRAFHPYRPSATSY